MIVYTLLAKATAGEWRL